VRGSAFRRRATSQPSITGSARSSRTKSTGSERAAAIPVVALTAHAMPDERARALAAGCDAYDTKPVDLPRLLSVITGLLPGGAGA